MKVYELKLRDDDNFSFYRVPNKYVVQDNDVFASFILNSFKIDKNKYDDYIINRLSFFKNKFYEDQHYNHLIFVKKELKNELEISSFVYDLPPYDTDVDKKIQNIYDKILKMKAFR